MRSSLSYLRWPLIVTFAGIVLAGWLGLRYTGTTGGMLSFLMIAVVLAILEISLSFDNAIVNANKLKEMTPEWQRRFLTWGILIAVFGMRIVFPLLIVVIAARIGPWAAVELAATNPEEYSRLIGEAHLPIAAFGGAFLMLVALTFFFDQGKEVDWIGKIERALRRCGSVRGMEVGFVLIIILVFVWLLPVGDEQVFMFSGIWGIVTFLAVDALGHVLDRWGKAQEASHTAAQAGLGGFLYLEVLDASFSFDGVIGAFALTQNLFLIAIGLGIGAMYVRSMTVMLVERGTLAEFRYLEHGAFWSILILSIIMFGQTMWHLPEVVTGLLGATFIATAFINSVMWNRRHRGAVE
ncbi:DUF475 domain-containing protein [Paracoccus sediminis]|uniref:DUF475 domain-containing protein n=1 Tax=Paracoccus sediminis TaxID=1214787 RepID=A0A238Y433_9RHOB|nr:DUF475 domain-containing protein [Paracoccus sediminis]TBN47259.1 DUF475 domain-containing protein [Paracoccus sediminis]SNR65965.1 hypothetical protein SAMN06265378_11477 [Paracoccus sediminis]